MEEGMDVIPWLDKCDILSMSDKRIVGVIPEYALGFKIEPRIVATMDENTRIFNGGRVNLVTVKHLGSHEEVSITVKLPLADPKFFDSMIKVIERFRNE